MVRELLFRQKENLFELLLCLNTSPKKRFWQTKTPAKPRFSHISKEKLFHFQNLVFDNALGS